MASTPFKFQADAGQTLTVEFDSEGGSGTAAASYSASGGTDGWYSVTITEALTGDWRWHAYDGNSNVVANGLADLADTTDTHYGFDPAPTGGGGGGATAAEVWDYLTSSIATSGSIGKLIVDNLDATISSRLAANDNGDGFTDIPWNSAWDAEVQSEVADALTAYDAATGSDVLTADEVWDYLTTSATTADSIGKLIVDNLDATITSRLPANDNGNGFTAIPWNNSWDSNVQSEVEDGLAAYDAATGSDVLTADEVWDYLTTSATTADSIGKLIVDNLDATITSRLPANDNGDGFTAIPWNSAWDAEVESEVTDALNAYDPPTRTEATSDKQEILDEIDGISGGGATPAEIWDYLTSSITTAGSIGKLIVDNLDAAITTRQASTDGSVFTAIPWNSAWDAEVESEVTDALNAYDPPTRTEATSDKQEILDYIDSNSGGATPEEIWDHLTSSISTAGSIGKLIVDNLDVAVSTRQQTTDGSVFTAIPWNSTWDSEVESEVTDALNAYDPPTRAEATSDKQEILDDIGNLSDISVDDVWNALIASYQNSGSVGEALQQALDQATIAANNVQP